MTCDLHEFFWKTADHEGLPSANHCLLREGDFPSWPYQETASSPSIQWFATEEGIPSRCSVINTSSKGHCSCTTDQIDLGLIKGWHVIQQFSLIWVGDSPLVRGTLHRALTPGKQWKRAAVMSSWSRTHARKWCFLFLALPKSSPRCTGYTVWEGRVFVLLLPADLLDPNTLG